MEAVTFHAQAEEGVREAVQWLKLGVELVGAAIIALGLVAVAGQLLRALWAGRTTDFTSIRLTLARYLALALEFQLGADILSTAIAPSWEQIRNLGAIAIIRTALNYFLSKEMQEERRTTGDEEAVVAKGDRGDRGQGIRGGEKGGHAYLASAQRSQSILPGKVISFFND